VSGDRRRQSGEFQFELDVVNQSSVSVVNSSVLVHVRHKSLAATSGGGRRRRRRFARVAVYRVTDEAVDRYPAVVKFEPGTENTYKRDMKQLKIVTVAPTLLCDYNPRRIRALCGGPIM